MKTMRAFNTNSDLKAILMAKTKQHRELDEYIPFYGDHQIGVLNNVGFRFLLKRIKHWFLEIGTGTWQAIKGSGPGEGTFKCCLPGCTIIDIEKAELSPQTKVPEFITRLQDRIFEGLGVDLRSHWTERLLTAIPVGADLTPVLPVFLLSLLDGLPPQEGKVKAAIEGVKEVLVTWIETGQVDKKAATRAAWTAEAAAWAARAAEATAGAAWAAEAAAGAAWAAEAAEAAGAATEAAGAAAGAAIGAVTRAARATANATEAWADIADKLIASIQTTTKGKSS